MTADMLLIRDEPVRDPGAMAEYRRINRENGATLGKAMTPLAVYGAVETLEEALPHRLKAATYRTVIVQGP